MKLPEKNYLQSLLLAMLNQVQVENNQEALLFIPNIEQSQELIDIVESVGFVKQGHLN